MRHGDCLAQPVSLLKHLSPTDFSGNAVTKWPLNVMALVMDSQTEDVVRVSLCYEDRPNQWEVI